MSGSMENSAPSSPATMEYVKSAVMSASVAVYVPTVCVFSATLAVSALP